MSGLDRYPTHRIYESIHFFRSINARELDDSPGR